MSQKKPPRRPRPSSASPSPASRSERDVSEPDAAASPDPASASAANDPVHRFLRALRLGAPQPLGRLTLWPLRAARPEQGGAAPEPPCFAPLAEALAVGEARLASSTADARRVLVENLGWRPLLVRRGEPLSAGGATHVARAAALVAGRSRVAIATSAADGLRRPRASDARELADAPRLPDGTLGFVARAGERVVALEALGLADAFAAAAPALLEALALGTTGVTAAPSREAGAPHRVFAAPEPFLAALGEARAEPRPALPSGEGEVWRLVSRRVRGHALVVEGGVATLSARPLAVGARPRAEDA